MKKIILLFLLVCISCKSSYHLTNKKGIDFNDAYSHRDKDSTGIKLRKGLYKWESNLREIYLKIHNNSVTIEQFLKTIDGTNSDKKHLTGNFPYTVKDSFLIIKTDTSFVNSLYNSAYLYKKQLIKENKIKDNKCVATDGNCKYQVQRIRLDTFHIFYSKVRKFNLLLLKKSKGPGILFKHAKNKRHKSNIFYHIFKEFRPKTERLIIR